METYLRPPLAEMTRIVKKFPENGVTANNLVSFSVRCGEIHGIVGENGSGKSTLMHILSGLLTPDQGEITFIGQKVSFSSPKEALAMGIGMVHQHIRLVRELKAWENIILGSEPILPWSQRGTGKWKGSKNRREKIIPGSWGLIDRKKAGTIIGNLCREYGLHLDLNKKTGTMSADELQKCALLSVLYHNIDLLILDEPFTIFTEQETETVFSIMNYLKRQGKSVIFITHKIADTLRLADRITIMRGGKVVGVKNKERTNMEEISNLMIGRENITFDQRVIGTPGKEIFSLKGVSAWPKKYPPIQDITFSLHASETLCLTGVRENGLETLERVLAGLTTPDHGSITIEKKGITGKKGPLKKDRGPSTYDSLSPELLRELGISYIPSDRLIRGASITSTVGENLILLNYRDFHSWGLLKQEEIDHYTASLRNEYNILGETHDSLQGLSGGNIQKVIISRELAGSPRLIIFSEPSWGLDFRSREFIYRKIEALKAQGSGILIITSDIDEALRLGDRLLVLYQGKVQADIPNRGKTKTTRVTRTGLGRIMLGMDMITTTEDIETS